MDITRFIGIDLPFLKENFTYDLVLTFVIILLIMIAKRITLKVLHEKIQDAGSYYKVKRSVTYFSFFLALLLIIVIWFQAGGSFSTYFGLISAGLAVALKDLVANVAGWFLIVFKRPFVVGDRIEIGTVKGDVIDQRLFQFSMMEIGNWVEDDQSTGRIIHMPNSKVFTEHLANYTTGFKYIWNEINVLLTFESDWRDAKEKMQVISQNHSLHVTEDVESKIRHASKKYMIYYKYLTPIVYTTVKESGVQLTIRYLCAPQNRRPTSEKIWEDILNMVEADENINLAYPTMRITK